ncbi:hypothetical protein KP766_00660 [Streptococcus equi subsp. equi]|nr:hypothetical protein [Streptococcus equi subsp. equi]
MTLSYEDKVQIYELRHIGKSIKCLSEKFSIAESDLKYMIRLIDRYGLAIVQKGKNNYYYLFGQWLTHTCQSGESCI